MMVMKGHGHGIGKIRPRTRYRVPFAIADHRHGVTE